jgi:competence protein ComEC
MPQSNYLPCRQPFLYLLTALVCGILIDKYLEPPAIVQASLLLFSIVATLWLMRQKRDFAVTFSLLLSFVLTGALLNRTERTALGDDRLQNLFAAQIINAAEPVELRGVLTAPPEPAPAAFFLDIEAERVRVFNQEMAASGRVKLFIALPDPQTASEFRELPLDYGSRICVLVRLERARAYKNPGSVDFNEFLEQQGYDLKGTIKSPLLIEPSGRVPINRILGALYHLRLRAMSAIDARFKPPVSGTLKAMLFGSRYFLDAETSERLRESSTFHTLVISGMHMTIIAWVILNLPAATIPLKSKGTKIIRRRPGWFRVLVALLVLWAYTAMVGLAPPVLRATIMISVGLIAPLFFRRAASINTVSLAAFLMLAVKPALVADPGFQLSFIAVAAMVTLALPLVNKLQKIGAWRPTAVAPHPPVCSRGLRTICEMLFWDAPAFDREMSHSPITYGLDKTPVAVLLSRARLQWVLRGVVVLLITSTAIQLLTLPLMAVYFNRVAPIGILLNIFSGLLTAIMMFGALGAILLGAIKAAWAVPAIALVNLAHHGLVYAIDPFLKIPAMTFRVAHYDGWQTLVYVMYFIPFALLARMIDRWDAVGERALAVSNGPPRAEEKPQRRMALSSVRQRRVANRKLQMAFACYLLPALLLSGFAVLNPPRRLTNGKFTIYFLDVGQGDAALVVFPGGTTLLIDGGGELAFEKMKAKKAEANPANKPSPETGQSPDQESEEDETNTERFSVGESVVSRFLWSRGLTEVDYVLATHADADHIGGLAAVVRNLRVGEALVGRVVAGNHEFDELVTASAGRATPLAILNAGQSFEIEGVRVNVLHPQATGRTQERSNNTSVVLRFVYGSTAVLMSGDIEKEAEGELLRSGADLRADVLKVAHHGSKTSSTEAFLDAVSPHLAIISVGERSRFGHPHRAVVQRFLSREIKLLQTGRSGMVQLESDGVTCEVKPAMR